MTAWFNEEQIYELTTPVTERIIGSIRQERIDEAIGLCDALREERIILHDFFADACTALYTWIGRNLGEERLKDLFTFSFEQSARRQIYDVMDPALKRGLEAFGPHQVGHLDVIEAVVVGQVGRGKFDPRHGGKENKEDQEGEKKSFAHEHME